MEPETLDSGISVLPPGLTELESQVPWPKYCECNRDSTEHEAGKCVKKPEFAVRRFEVGEIRVCGNCMLTGDMVL